jgi:uncharacterized membrane protein YbaN (DUF454 family)
MDNIRKQALIIGGTIFVVLGVIGMFVPLMPSTVFLLLAAACYAHGSKRFYDWLINHPTLGASIKHYRDGQGLPLRQKLVTLLLLWASIGASGYFFVSNAWIKLLLFTIAVGVTWHILSLKTFREGQADPVHLVRNE